MPSPLNMPNRGGSQGSSGSHNSPATVPVSIPADAPHRKAVDLVTPFILKAAVEIAQAQAKGHRNETLVGGEIQQILKYGLSRLGEDAAFRRLRYCEELLELPRGSLETEAEQMVKAALN